MNPPSPHRRRRPIDKRRAERELFFWTANRVLLLVLGVAIVVFVIVQTLHGHNPIKLLVGLRIWPLSS